MYFQLLGRSLISSAFGTCKQVADQSVVVDVVKCSVLQTNIQNLELLEVSRFCSLMVTPGTFEYRF